MTKDLLPITISTGTRVKAHMALIAAPKGLKIPKDATGVTIRPLDTAIPVGSSLVRWDLFPDDPSTTTNRMLVVIE